MGRLNFIKKKTSSIDLNGIYFDSINGNDTTGAGTFAAPYQSIAKINSELITLPVGYKIYLKCGSSWIGVITVPNSGTALNPVVITSYGTGAKPIITGFETVTGWTVETNGIYSRAITAPSIPNVVTLNGVNRALGRFPKTTYRTVDSYSGMVSITDAATLSTDINWTGAQLVIRKNNWMWHRFPVTNHVGSTITYSGGNSITPTVGWGFYFQHDLHCLTELGDWAFINGKIYMYFGAANPTLYTVKIATVDMLVNLSNKTNIIIENLDLVGCNTYGVYTTGISNTIKDTNISYIGNNGIQTWFGASYLKVSNCEIYECQNRGIHTVEAYGIFNNNNVHDIAMLRGMLGDNLNNAGVGIASTTGGADGSNTLIEYNRVDNIGYNGISFGDDNSVVRYNYVTNYCAIINDGGGIYTSGSTSVGRQIYNNICIGAPMLASVEGTPYTTAGIEGIYLDINASNIVVYNNTCAFNPTSGLFLHGGTNITAYNNVCYANTEQQLLLVHDPYVTQLANNNVYNNQFFSPTAVSTEHILMHDESDATTSFGLFGTLDNNYYCKPLLETDMFKSILNGATSYRTFALWKTYSGLDANSHLSPITVSDASKILFEYNETLANKVISLVGTYVKLDGTAVAGSITLAPYTSIILLKEEPIIDPNALYYVSTTGSDTTGTGTYQYPWASLYKASQLVTTAGSVIHILSGTYTESHMCSIAVGVNIIGEGQDNTIINCTYAFTVLPYGDFTKGSIALSSTTENTSGNQSISDLTLDGGWINSTSTNTTTATRGILIYRRGNVTLNRITVKNFWVCGVGFYGGYPFSQPTVRTDGNVIMYSLVRNNGNGYWNNANSYESGACVELYGQSNLLVHHNTISNKDRFDHTSDLMARFDFCTGLKIYNNEFYKTEEEEPNNLWNFGLETWNIQGGCEIYDNNFYGSLNAIDIGGPVNTKGTYDYSVKVYRNRIVRENLVNAELFSSSAIYLEAKADCSDIYIYENYIENYPQALGITDGSATEVNHKARIHFYKNLAVNCGWQQTWTMPAVSISTVVNTGNTITDLYIENNTFVGIAGKSQYGIDYFSVGTSNNIFIRNNIFYQLTNSYSTGFVDLPEIKSSWTSGPRSNFSIENNLAYLTGNSNNVSYTGIINFYVNANNLKVDPLFVSATDFRLQLSSPARDAGIDVGLPFNGIAPDIGYSEIL